MTIGVVIDALNAADQFTGDTEDGTQTESSIKGFAVEGPFNLSLVGIWTGNLFVQRRFLEDESELWRDVNSFVVAAELHDEETEARVFYRVGFKAAEPGVTGIVNVRLSN